MKLLAIAALIIISQIAFCVSMQPMEAQITLGQNKMAEFTLKNDLPYPVAMKAGVFERKPNAFGQEGKHKEASSKLFEVIKPNIILMPNGDKKGRDIKKVRVYYKGGNKATIEDAYRIIIQQLPVDLDRSKKQKNKVRFLAKFVGALYITPKEAQPKLLLSDIKKKRGQVTFKVKNTGSRRDFIESLKISFAAKDKKNKPYSRIFKGEELKNIYHHTILSGRTRNFTFNIPNSLLKSYPNAQQVSVTLN